MDTFWYIDPDYGIDGVWDNSLARLEVFERGEPARPPGGHAR
jgi:hypothetical protein